MWPFSLFKKKTIKPDQPKIEYSKYFSDKFYTNKPVTFDDSIEYFIRKSNVKIPTSPLFVKEFKDWKLEEDEFEEIILEDGKYKLLYDKTNDIFYLMQKIGKYPDGGNLTVPDITIANDKFLKWSGAMNVNEKNEMLAIFDREISEEANEYLFIELDSGDGRGGNFNETYWYGIIIQPNLIN